MTASELFAIVKDVPREAWPPMLYWMDNETRWALSDHDYHDEMKLDAELAELLFIGSMVRWLVSEDLDPCMSEMFSEIDCEGNRTPIMWEVDLRGTDTEDGRTNLFAGNSLVEALANACKACHERTGQ